MGPASRRQVLSPETLAAFGASPIYSSSSSASDDDSVHCATPSASQFSKYFATSTSVESPIIGVKIGGWTITTQNSSIGDEQKMETLTELLEEIANSKDDVNDNNDVQSQAVVRQRRLCAPEITFLDAFISLRYDFNSSHDGGDTAHDEDNTTTSSEIRFNATDALSEWAEAHQSLETQPEDETEHDVQISLSSNKRKECRGVAILRTLDAKVWSNKSKQLTDDTTSDSGTHGRAAAHSSEFYYDWTFSSPYAGTILTNSSSSSNSVDLINNRQQWQPLSKSQIPFHLLQDTSQPILLYDDIHLFEDDLHDNGESSLNIKIRVMPKCWYVLQRLFVRVDYVCVKCREVRYFCLLDGSDAATNSSATKTACVGNSCKPNVVYRDITWREASWAELSKMNLPVDPSAWMEQNRSGSGSGIGGNFSIAVPSFAALLTNLPVVTVPEDLKKHARFPPTSSGSITYITRSV